MRPALVPGRWPGSVLTAVGVLLALPSVVWPVLAISVSQGGDTTASGEFRQGIWSWGKYATLGNPTGGEGFEISNSVGLVFLVATLAIGLGGGLAWALIEGSPGTAIGLAGTGAAAVAQLGSISQWGGEELNGFYGGENGAGVEIQLSGWLQIASVAVLALAAGVMAWRPLCGLLAPLWQTYGVGRRTEMAEGTEVAEVAEAPAGDPRPLQLGTAVMREPDDPSRAGPHDDRPSVGFSDDERATGRRSRRRD